MKSAQKARSRTPATVNRADEGPTVSIGVAAAVYFGLALLFFLPAFFPGKHIYGTDYLVGGYIFHEFISQRFADGSLPKWVPHVYGGLPLFANPGSTYHPLRFIADAIFHTSRIWPTYFVIHFGLAGLGTYLLSREIGVRSWVAFLAGLAFQFTGITMSWVLGGHEGRIIVATLTPLVFYFFHRGIRTAALTPFVGAAAAIGIALLTFQIQSSYYLLFAAAIWSAFCLWTLGAFRRRRELLRLLVMGFGAVAFAFALASVNFLPFVDYVDASPRAGAGGRGYEYSTSFSMPPREVLAIAVPDDVGFLETYRGTNPFKLHVEYVGMTVVLLLGLGLVVARRNRYWWLFAGLAVFALTLAFGGNTPLYRLYYELLPGTKRFRAPAISFFLVSFSLVMMAGLAMEQLAAWRARRAARPRADPTDELGRAASWVLGGLVAILAISFFLVAGDIDGGDPAARTRAIGFGRSLLFALLVAVVLWAWLGERLRSIPALVLLSLLTVGDLWIVDRNFFSTVESPDTMYAPDDVVRFLEDQSGRPRVWVLPLPQGSVYRSHGNYLMRFGIDQAGGEHGNQLQRFNEYLGAGEEVYVDWHNFLEEIQVVQMPEGPALSFRSVPGFLESANIEYIISVVPLANPQLQEVHRGSALVYRVAGALPRAFLVAQVETESDPYAALTRMSGGWDASEVAIVTTDQAIQLPAGPLDGTAEIVEYGPDRVVVRTQQDRAAFLVLADNHYPDWVARVDGVEREIYPTNHAFRGILLEAGEHVVTFSFEPRDLRIGFWIYITGMALLAAYGSYLIAILIIRRRGSLADV